MLAAEYGSDLPSVKAELEHHQQEHKVIDQFHSKILHAERQQSNFSGDELNLYQQRLNQLQKLYAELLATSTKRLSDLDSLLHFLSQASAELQWLNEREQTEISRDWADKNLDLPSIHRYYEVHKNYLYKFCIVIESVLANLRHKNIQFTFKRSYGSGEEVSSFLGFIVKSIFIPVIMCTL